MVIVGENQRLPHLLYLYYAAVGRMWIGILNCDLSLI